MGFTPLCEFKLLHWIDFVRTIKNLLFSDDLCVSHIASLPTYFPKARGGAESMGVMGILGFQMYMNCSTTSSTS